MKKIFFRVLVVVLVFTFSAPSVFAQTGSTSEVALRAQLLELIQKLTIVLEQLKSAQSNPLPTIPTNNFPTIPNLPTWLPPASNNPPVISGVVGPDSLTPNEVGTWQVSASDPEGGRIGYSIFWGDYTAPVVNESGVFSRSYPTPGIYYLTFTVTDAGGKTVRSNKSVTVANRTLPTVAGSVSITAVDDTNGESINAQITVVSATGRIIGTGNTYRGPISFSALPAGVYTVTGASLGYRLGTTSFSIVRDGDLVNPVLRLNKIRP